MAFRRKTRRSFTRKAQDLVWVTKISEFQATDLGIVGGEVLTGPDWDPSGAQSFERGTLLRIVGTIMWAQTANATTADVPYLGWMLYKDAQGLGASLVDPTSAANMFSTDILHWTGAMLASTASGTVSMIQREAVDVRTKRKLTNGESIYMTTRIPADTATPAANVVALLRFLVNRA
jgi:hypothetical protein